MEKIIAQLWEFIGVQPVWAAILTLLLLVVVYFLKKLIDTWQAKQKTNTDAIIHQYADVSEFVKEQSVGLITAYVDIFEKKEGVEATGKDFMDIIAKADNDLMKPLRKYQAKLDSTTKAKIFNVHNILAQYYPNASNQALMNFKTQKNQFYKVIHEAQDFLKPELILRRLGVISKKL